MQLLNSSEDSVDLEGKSPSLGLLVVLLEHIDILSVKVLPLRDRLFNPFGLRDLLPQYFKESRFPTADVALNSVAIIIPGKLGVKGKVLDFLIYVSR